MFNRLCNPLLSHSFFLFGARGTGKSTLVKSLIESKTHWYIDLLSEEQEDRFSRHPDSLYEELMRQHSRLEWVIIDEVQKIPRLLDVVHRCLERFPVKFALTGSSARKLKRGSANLLAGRAFLNHLFPLLSQELGDQFSLDTALQWGTLPSITHLDDPAARKQYLMTYGRTYLKEEIVAEQVVRKLRPFQNFLEVAAQSNGTIVNFSAIARDVGVETATVQSYFQILEDTLIGFFLPAFHRSVRKQQRHAPKFYLIDMGMKRSLDRTLDIPLKGGTYEFGRAFESFVMNELYRLNEYHQKDYALSYLMTKDGLEIDVMVDRPGRPLALVEITSTTRVDTRDLRALVSLQDDFAQAECFCLSLDPHERIVGRINVLPWQVGMTELGLSRKFL